MGVRFFVGQLRVDVAPSVCGPVATVRTSHLPRSWLDPVNSYGPEGGVDLGEFR